MDERAVAKQLDHMVKFIYREADEKAQEISAKAAEEFAIEKATIVQDEKLKIAAEYERKKNQIEVQKRIEHSNALNQSRLQVLKAREEALQDLLAYSHKKLSTFATDEPARYKTLVRQLIVEGVQKVEESEVTVIFRAEDKAIVEEAARGAADDVEKLTGKRPTIRLEDKGYLPPSNKGDGSPFCSGGVLVSGMHGAITCSNTLDARLSQAFARLAPEVRRRVYGERKTSQASNGDLLG